MKVCITCLKELHCENEYCTLDDDNNFISFRSKLLFCVPEVDLEVFQHTIICISCSELLNLAYDFKNNCIRSEQTVRDSQEVKESQTSVLMNSSDVVDDENSKIDIEESDLKESCVQLANDDSSVLMNLSNVICEEDDSKIDIKEEPCVPLSDIVINEDLPFIIIEQPGLQYGLFQGNVPSLAGSCHEVTSENYDNQILNNQIENECETILNNTLTNAQKCQQKLHCNNCRAGFLDKRLLRDHIDSNIKEKSFKCKDCKEDFVMKMILDCRTDDADEKIQFHCGVCQVENKFQCGICQQNFLDKNVLIEHVLIHLAKKPFHCNSFRFRKILKNHLITHIGKKGFSCNVCKKSYTSKHNLVYHIMNHTDRRPFSCNVCQKSFASKQNLVNHNMNHTGRRPFSCNVCQKSFRLKAALSRHIIIHTGEKRLCCNICQKSFTNKRNLRSHIMSHQ